MGVRSMRTNTVLKTGDELMNQIGNYLRVSSHWQVVNNFFHNCTKVFVFHQMEELRYDCQFLNLLSVSTLPKTICQFAFCVLKSL